jgi:hypothetical protein
MAEVGLEDERVSVAPADQRVVTAATSNAILADAAAYDVVFVGADN